MYEIAYLGRWETLPETAAAICDHDTSKLEALLQGGLDLDVPIQLSEYIKLMPLEIAVFQNDVPMIHFLLEHGADRPYRLLLSGRGLDLGAWEAVCEIGVSGRDRMLFLCVCLERAGTAAV